MTSRVHFIQIRHAPYKKKQNASRTKLPPFLSTVEPIFRWQGYEVAVVEDTSGDISGAALRRTALEGTHSYPATAMDATRIYDAPLPCRNPGAEDILRGSAASAKGGEWALL